MLVRVCVYVCVFGLNFQHLLLLSHFRGRFMLLIRQGLPVFGKISRRTANNGRALAAVQTV